MPRLQFSTILTRVKAVANVTAQDALIKEGIQMALDRLTDADLPYLMTSGFITTVAPYSTGTVTATNNSTTITGSGTTFTSAMVGRKIRIASQSAYYRISAFVSTTEVTLEVAYQNDTTSGATYSIYKDEYRLPANLDIYKVLRQIEDSVTIAGLEPSAFDLLIPTPQAQGGPRYEILVGTRLDTYATGTVSGTVGTKTVTGSATSWTTVEGLGQGTRITVGTVVYTVNTVDSDTQITIHENLASTISAGTSYTIHLDNYLIQLYPIPDDTENVYFRYQRLPYPLVDDEDIPDLPEKYHHLLITGGLIWAWAVKDKQESKATQLLFEAGRAEMWRRIGNISVSRKYHRASQDELTSLTTRYSLPANYGIPIKL